MTCFLFVGFSCGPTKIQHPETIKVGIQPYKGYPAKYTTIVQDAIESYYGFQTVILPVKQLPATSYTLNIPELAKYQPQARYRADTIIRVLKRELPDSINYVVGLTHKDISITKRTAGVIRTPEWRYRDFGIFGLGFRPGTSCIVSSHRLWSGNVSEEKMIERMRKVTLHEIGHMLGLPHCPNTNCIMTDANEKISTIDNNEPKLCDLCKNKIGLHE